MCRVNTVSALPDSGDDRSHYAAISFTVVFISYPLDKPQGGWLELVLALFECITGEIRHNLKQRPHRPQVVDAYTIHLIANFALRHDIRVRVLWVKRFIACSLPRSI